MQHRNDSEREGEDLILKDSRMYKKCMQKEEGKTHALNYMKNNL